MFRMYGDIVELYRYAIEYEEIERNLVRGETVESTVIKTEYCISDEHRDDFIAGLNGKNYTVTPIEQSGNEWINGFTFDSWEQAKEALDMGREAYIEKVNTLTEIEILQMAILDMHSMMLQTKKEQIYG